MIAQRRAVAHADAAPRPVTSASRKASAKSGRSAYLAPSFESWFHSARLTAVATHECVCDYRLRKRQMHRGVATVMFRVICQSRGGRSDPLGRRLLAAAGVRRCRRPEARPLADLSDFHPADLSDFRPPLTSDVAAGASTLRTARAPRTGGEDLPHGDRAIHHRPRERTSTAADPHSSAQVT